MKLSIKKLSDLITENDFKNLLKPYNPSSIELKIDETTGKNKGFGFAEIPDDKTAQKAIRELDGKQIMGRSIRVRPYDTHGADAHEHSKPIVVSPVLNKNEHKSSPASPYSFAQRKPEKKPLEEFHDKLLKGHYDIAFELTWETLTPTAANPCVGDGDNCYPMIEDNEYTGYNKRWLTIGNKLAISPFTVKSAIANGFANILGGCYRVNTKEAGHGAGFEEGQYPYGGAYKRYRVSMNDRSRPGLFISCDKTSDGGYEIQVQPVIEYYYDSGASQVELIPGGKYFAESNIERRRHIIQTNTLREVRPGDRTENILIYYGPYRFGMDLTLGPGDLGKNHYHRFYKEDNIKGIRKGVISAEHFEPPKKLKEKVYLGKFKRLNRPDDRFQYDNKIWYEDLNVLAEALKNGQKPWIYYEEFDGKTTNIGKNFLFKALFLHEDTVPEGNSECKDHSGNMCPRCRMFGMTDKTEDKNDSIGFKGRFKASALVNNYEIEEGRETKHIKFGDITAPLKTWVDKTAGKLIAQQEFLPISGPPKPNKRDIDGYYNERAGRIKGAKYYLHGKLDSARNINNIDENNDYTHRLRSYAQVCESGVQFAGTIGAENCTPEEIAAFLILLHSDISSHGFKIGIGKALGMGTVKSSINNIWIRTQKDYDHWISISTENHVTDEMIKKLEGNIPDISEKFSLLKKVTEQTAHILNSMKDMNKRSLSYPSPEKKKNPEQMQYWDLFNSRRLK